MKWIIYSILAGVLIYIMFKKYNTEQIINLIEQSAYDNNIDPNILLAIAQQESSFNPSNKNLKDPNGGSYGLFGLTLKYAQTFQPNITAEDLLNPVTNINIAIQLLKSNMKFGSTPADIFDEWNSGIHKDSTGNIVPTASPNLDKYMAYYKQWSNT